MSIVCLLDAMEINLANMDLFIGEWISRVKNETDICDTRDCLNLGSYSIKKHELSLLQEKCELQLLVERNISAHIHKSGNYLSTQIQGVQYKKKVL